MNTTEELTKEYLIERMQHVKDELKLINVYGQVLTKDKYIQLHIAKIYARLDYIKAIIKD